MFELKDVPAWSIHPKPGRSGLFAFFKKPWDGLQTSVRVVPDDNEALASNLAPNAIKDYLNRNCPKSNLPVSTNTLSTFTQDFIKDELFGLAKRTIEMYEGHINQFIKRQALEGRTAAEHLTWPVVRDYFIELRDANRANKGIDNVIDNLRRWGGYIAKKTNTPNHFAEIKKVGGYSRRNIIWFHHEFNEMYAKADDFDKGYYMAAWHCGMYPADFFWMRKQHIKPYEDDFIIEKLREKSGSPKAVICFPLKHCPARSVFIDAYHKAKNPNDRLFFPELGDTEEAYETWHHNLNQRRRRHWLDLFPGFEHKWFQDIRHTFATECANGARFGRMIPEFVLDYWMGWVPGSAMGRKYYIARQAMPSLMAQTHLATSSLVVPPLENLHDRLPFT